MTNKEILEELRVIFSSARSPGQAFDAILKMRKADVDFHSLQKAFAEASADGFEHVQTSAKPASDTMPVGKYRGKPLGEIASRDPGYLRWAIENMTHISDDFRRLMEQALEDEHEPLNDREDDCLSNEL